MIEGRRDQVMVQHLIDLKHELNLSSNWRCSLFCRVHLHNVSPNLGLFGVIVRCRFDKIFEFPPHFQRNNSESLK